MNRHAVIDLETLSTKSNAAITQIGIAVFDIDEPAFSVLSQFNVRIDLEVYKSDLPDWHIDGKTLKWWLQQPNVKDLISNEATDDLDALGCFEDWIRNQLEIEAWWGNGAGFDNVIFRNWLGTYLEKQYLAYYKDRDIRTLLDLAKRCGWTHNFKNEHPHDALYDAVYEARLVHSAFNYVRRMPWAST